MSVITGRTILSFQQTSLLVRRSLFITLALAGVHGSLQAQNNLPAPTPATSDTAVERKLVELALNSPEALKVKHESRIYEYQLRNAKNSWMNLLTVSTTYNDQSFNVAARQANIIYPKYFFGLNIPLGTLLSRTSVKSAREGVEIGKLNEEEIRRQLKVNVLSKYKQYKAQSEIIALETGFMNDLQAALTQAEDKFRKGAITFDAYNLSLRSRNDEQAKLINLKLAQDLLKLDIERIIGTSLETVLK